MRVPLLETVRLTSRGVPSVWRSAAIALGLLGCLLLAACGVTPAPGLGGQSSANTTPAPTGTPATPAAADTQLPSGSVVLTVASGEYTRSSTIIVTLTNRSSGSIFAYDHQTSCTILSLQRQTSGGGQTVGACALGILTRQIEIRAGETMKIALAPGAGTIRAAPWPAGTYHAVLRYTLRAQATSPGATAMTGEFTVA
jgi:hypothetical protein